MNLEDLRPYQRSDIHRGGRYGNQPPDISITLHDKHRTKAGDSLSVLVSREKVGAPRQLELYRCEVYTPEELSVHDSPNLGIVSHELFGEIDPKGRCLYASEALVHFLTTDVLLGSDVPSYFHQEDAVRLHSLIAGNPRAPFTIDTMRIPEIGDTFRFHAMPIRHDDGSARGYAFVLERS